MESQRWDPETYAKNAGFVAEFGRDVLALLAPQARERVLDLGCGDGALTERLVLAGCSVVGVDNSAAQIAGARTLGLDARVASGESLPFESEFDAVFSNAALHWMRAADAVVQSVFRALRPGGRLIGELGGAGNVDTIRRALTAALERRGVNAESLDPWLFPTPQWYRHLLEHEGFEVGTMLLFPRNTIVPTDITGWLKPSRSHFWLPSTPMRDGPFSRKSLRRFGRVCMTPNTDGRWTTCGYDSPQDGPGRHDGDPPSVRIPAPFAAVNGQDIEACIALRIKRQHHACAIECRSRRLPPPENRAHSRSLEALCKAHQPRP